MCARSYRRPRGSHSDIDYIRPSRVNLSEWIRAWRAVMRDPDKTIPEPGLGPEGDPIPADLDLHCPECDYNLSGLTEWRCPECGKPFNPRRAYTLQMLKQPEYFLRYRVAPEDIRRTFWALVMLAAGIVLTVIAAVLVNRRGGMVPATVGIGGLSAFLFLSLPTMVFLHWLADIPWPRILFYIAIPWLGICTLFLGMAIF